MDYNKLKLDEENKINIFGNMIIKSVLEDIKEKDKYVNYFYKGGNKHEVKKYVFYFLLSEKNMELLMDSKSILDGNLLKNKYNNFLSEDNIILLFMRLKIYIISGIASLPFDSIFQNIYDSKILQYENFLEKDTCLLEKNISNKIKNDIIFNEIKKIRISSMGFYLLLSYYIFNYSNSGKTNLDKKNFQKIIDKVEKIIRDFLDEDKNLNIDLDDFWKYLISCI